MNKILIYLFLAQQTSSSDLFCRYDDSKSGQATRTDQNGKVCHFDLYITESLTKTARMKSYPGPSSQSPRFPIEFTADGRVIFGNNKHYEEGTAAAYAGIKDPENLLDISQNITDVIYGDGIESKSVIMINGESPGPTLHIPENAYVSMTVHNKMITRSTTIHCHGVKQENSWYYDGSAISQCPILPESSFTYRFLAKPNGVQWYHAHMARQRMEGLFGLMVIGRPNYTNFNLKPIIIHEFSSLNSMQSVSEFQTLHKDSSYAASNDEYQKWYRQDGSELNAANYDATMINGRGRAGNSNIPFEIFRKDRNDDDDKLRLVVANFGGEYMHEFSVSGHRLKIIEADGTEIEPFIVDFIQLTPGERYVVELEAIPISKFDLAFCLDNAQQSHTFAIRVETCGEFGIANKETWIDMLNNGIREKMVQNAGGSDAFYLLSKEEKFRKSAFAYLTYTKSQDVLDDIRNGKYENIFLEDKDQRCSPENPCKVLNCGFDNYADYVRPNIICVDNVELKATSSELEKAGLAGLGPVDTIQSMVMSFRVGGNINGVRFKDPFPPLSQKKPNGWSKCQKCTGQLNYNNWCTNIYKFELNSRVKFVLTSGDQSGFDPLHTFHLHGHKMKILATGFSKKNITTGFVEDFSNPHNSEDLELLLKPASNDPNFMIMTGVNLINEDEILASANINGPLKDTLAVPTGGWALVEINFNNPGLFHFHCHMTSHILEGQAAVFQVGEEIPFPLEDDDWPVCGDYLPGSEVSDFEAFMGNLEVFPPNFN